MPVYASTATHTWTTQADFEAGVLDNVDTSYSPGDVELALNLDIGTGAFDYLVVDGMFYTDDRRGAITQQNNAGSNIVHVDTPAGRFFSGDEVLIIQMTGGSEQGLTNGCNGYMLVSCSKMEEDQVTTS